MPRSIAALTLSLALLAGCASAPERPEDRLARQVMFTVADNPALSLVNGYAADTYPGITARRDTVEPQVRKIMSLHRLKKISRWPIKALGLEAIVAEIRGPRSVEQVVEALSRDQRVESVQPVMTYDLLAYNDPYFHLQNAALGGAGIEQIHSMATGKDVVVAVVDTGLDRQHPEFASRIIQSRNFVDHDLNQFDLDEHGTSVAGVIGSTANNDLGIVGVAPDVKLMAFKSCWQDSHTRRASCDSYSIMKALVEVLKQHPDILNLSLAGPRDPLIERLLQAAIDRGIIVIAAVDADRERSFPASMRQVLAVGSSLQTGLNMPENGILAPGTDILTTTPGATYAFRSGSSMATAYVSGIAALMKERQPTLTGDQLRALLSSTSRDSVNRVPVVDICQAVLGDDEALCPAAALVSNTGSPGH